MLAQLLPGVHLGVFTNFYNYSVLLAFAVIGTASALLPLR